MDPSRIYEATENRREEAERLLEEEPIIPLTHEVAVALAGEAPVEAPGISPFLVPGLYLYKGTGRFSLYSEGDSLVVHHGCLGSGPTAMKRQPLAVLLDEAPLEVYVTCSMAP